MLFAQGDNREQFFDMEADPDETKNLIADVSLAGEVERHRSLLKQWMENTRDTFGKARTATKTKKRRSPAGATPKNATPKRKNNQ
ncbi:MAG TPA: hypothetical protein VMY37_13345 [Thermoguttaceae bacterium]|nr:hypothetical protein [Thermoguttaceae bacterium]